MTPLLQASHLEKQFLQANDEYLKVVKDINLTLAPGEIVCLLGASGSGKTTLLRILAGLDDAFGGSVRSDVQRPGAQLGYLSQNDGLLPWRSVLGNVALSLELLGKDVASSRQAALEVLQQVGMGRFVNSYPSQLSGGMAQRVLLARTLVLRPRLFLLDEPMSNLDVLARQELSTLIKKYVHDNQSAALVVTHSVEEACFLADRVLLLTRSPAMLFKEIRIADDGHKVSGALSRDEALTPLMNDLLAALGRAA